MKHLRILTAKSILGFGKYADLKVGTVLNVLSGHWYLAWCYYNLSMISFHEEILEEIFITPDLKIQKPGTDPELYLKYCKIGVKKIDHPGVDQHIKDSIRKSRQKAKMKGMIQRDKIKYSKSNMAWKNQGHR